MGYENQDFPLPPVEAEHGPSWARPNWPPVETDDLTGALDPTQMQVAVKAAAKAQGKAVSDADAVQAADPPLSRAWTSGRQSRSAGPVAA